MNIRRVFPRHGTPYVCGEADGWFVAVIALGPLALIGLTAMDSVGQTVWTLVPGLVIGVLTRIGLAEAEAITEWESPPWQ